MTEAIGFYMIIAGIAYSLGWLTSGAMVRFAYYLARRRPAGDGTGAGSTDSGNRSTTDISMQLCNKLPIGTESSFGSSRHSAIGRSGDMDPDPGAVTSSTDNAMPAPQPGGRIDVGI